MSSTSLPAPQQFYQQVIQKYGWYSKYDTDENDCWFLEIIVGIRSKHIIIQSNEKDFKIAKTILSTRAMLVLQNDIAQEESKPLESLSQVFPNPIVIYDSSKKETWKRFWESKPTVVGIDVEGNQKSPPVLVQISTNDYTILEVPRDKLSDDLVRLLKDDSITKVFCDNGSHKDKKCLGLYNSESEAGEHDTLDLTIPPVVDLEVLFGNFAGQVKAARGLSKIMAMCLGMSTSSGGFTEVLNVRIGKPRQASKRMKNVGRFALIEQGKMKPLRGLKDLSHDEKQYAALDAWCTLQAYYRLHELEKKNDLPTEPTTITLEGNDEGVQSTINTDADSKEETKLVDKDSKEWLLRENKRLSTQLQDNAKQLNDAKRRIAELENQVKSLQASKGGNPGQRGGGRGGGRGGRGTNSRKRQVASIKKENQQHLQETK